MTILTAYLSCCCWSHILDMVTKEVLKNILTDVMGYQALIIECCCRRHISWTRDMRTILYEPIMVPASDVVQYRLQCISTSEIETGFKGWQKYISNLDLKMLLKPF